MNRSYLKLIPWFFLVGLFAFLSVFMWNHAEYLTNADMASEMILGKILSEEKAVVTPNWYYSTELRVLNINQIYAFLFHIFRDWAVVRAVTCMISYLLMIVTYYYLIYQLGEKKIFAVSAILLLLPLSDCYFDYVFKELLYAPFISSSFLAFGMMFHYEHASKRVKKVLLVAIMTLALLSGMGGARHVVILYLPMLLATIFMVSFDRKNFGYLVCAIMSFIASGVGYLINTKVFARFCHFLTWGDIEWRKFSFDGIADIFFGTLRILGYSYGDVKTPLASAFSCLLAVVIALCVLGCIGRNIKTPDRTWLLSMYIVCAYAVFGGIYSFTNMLYGDRYSISVIMLAVPVIFISLYRVTWKRYVKLSVGIILMGGVLISGLIRYDHYSKIDKTEELRAISSYLAEDQKISTGYATFWNANILTELSNGFIDVYCWKDDVSQLSGKDDLLQWLQKTSHEETYPEGRIFILLTKDEYEECSLKAHLEKDKAEFSSENYVMFIFENYESFTSSVQWEK